MSTYEPFAIYGYIGYIRGVLMSKLLVYREFDVIPIDHGCKSLPSETRICVVFTTFKLFKIDDNFV